MVLRCYPMMREGKGSGAGNLKIAGKDSLFPSISDLFIDIFF